MALFLPSGSHRRLGVLQSVRFLVRSFHVCLIMEEEQPWRKRFLGSKQTHSVADTFHGPMASQAGGRGYMFHLLPPSRQAGSLQIS